MGALRRTRTQPPHLASPSATPSRTTAQSTNHQESPILGLQRAIGNQAVQQLMRAQFDVGQAVSSVGEGDRVSVVPAAPQSPRNPQTNVAIDSPSDSPGQPLDAATRAFMETRFHHDFSKVRVHADEVSESLADRWNAHALTLTNHIYFGVPYEPSSPAGKALLAHELTHVVQTDSANANPAQPSSSIEMLEREARQVSASIHGTASVPPIRGSAQNLSVPLRQGPDDLGAPTFGNLPLDTPYPSSLRRVELVNEGGKWREINTARTAASRTAKGSYDFVVQDGRIWAVKSGGHLGHTEAALGRRVTWAGQINFDKQGALQSWDNASGHYLASGSFAENAARAHPDLTMDKFVRSHSGPVFRPGVEGGRPPHREGPQLPVIQEETRPRSAPSTKTAGAEASATEAGTAEAKATSTEAKAVSTEVKVASTEVKAAHTFSSFHGLPKIGALDAVFFYLDIHAPHFKALEAVSDAVEIAEDLLNRVDELENGARELKKVVEDLRSAEANLPGEPMPESDSADPRLTVDELNYLRDYYRTAGSILSGAFDARVKLNRKIIGWNTVVAQAERTRNFTRASAWDAVNQLDLRFSQGGNGFLNFLLDVRDSAERVEHWARVKSNGVADIACVKERPVEYMVCLANAIANGLVR